MKYVSAFQPRYQFNHCAPAVVWLMVWVLCFTDPLSAATPVPWERNLVVNGVARAGNMSCWTQESLYPTDIEWKCQLTTTRACDLGTMFSGPTGISPQSLHMCRISQRIFIAPILAEMNTLLRLSLRRQRVLIHTSASLAAYNDASSFSVRQLNSNGVINVCLFTPALRWLLTMMHRVSAFVSSIAMELSTCAYSHQRFVGCFG
ncbi:Hypothetical protein, putative [Bodo saltans]|uniref:Membrane-associated protein n=1 Tax=Bodo saltans TaxID=75058 RepID=A0A0S4KJG5_BODSA|nr:Hypothetical protein, putative [Bodo saltans]|eukprot:CUI14687.1 Hypothetical protein, putative [Bodo saltans]